METDYNSENSNNPAYQKLIQIKAEMCLNKLRKIIEIYKINLELVFKKFDKDKTNKLNKQEFFNIAKIIDENINIKEAGYIFDKFDVNHDGGVSL